MAEAERRAWVARVLGIELPTEADAEELPGRLKAAGQSLKSLQAAGAPEVRDLALALKAATQATGPDAADRVNQLEAALARAMSGSRAREAAASNPRTLDTTKLLLRWRDAQKRVDEGLTGLGRSILGRKDVQADPRLPAVRRAVAELPNLVPKFGGRLEDLLDKAMNQGSMTGIASDALAAVAEYRTELAGASVLLRLETFAGRHVGNVALHAELDRALGELEQQIAAAA